MIFILLSILRPSVDEHLCNGCEMFGNSVLNGKDDLDHVHPIFVLFTKANCAKRPP